MWYHLRRILVEKQPLEYSSLWSATVVEDTRLVHVEVAARPFARSTPSRAPPRRSLAGENRTNTGSRSGIRGGAGP